ncbi:S1C family serine protease [Phytoactinopolyspora halotolerans]|uniref:PDZ domain-containing protein n=1 Tax=Phytoactinopolyspora halotolerans TaxID=1981512 RepID=A0A6L9SGH4_9ACTN|nr:trypsin-like peptidase domain-containing protein [Phytoactinopolyspora halotolerans]NEE04239.1 PDZ domain-containing protein [Phytoactinopolyspora halotolerans]
MNETSHGTPENRPDHDPSTQPQEQGSSTELGTSAGQGSSAEQSSSAEQGGNGPGGRSQAGGTGWSNSPGAQGPPPPWQPRPAAPAAPGTPPPAQPPAGHEHAGAAAAPGGAPGPHQSGPHQSGAGPAYGDAQSTSTHDTAVFSAPAGNQSPSRQGRGRMLLAGLALGAVLGGGTGAGVAVWLTDSADDEPARSSLEQTTDTASDEPQATPLDSVEAVASQVTPSVVTINVGAGPFGQTAGGTGVIISSDGEIMTNNHVVQAASGGQGQIEVTFSDGSTAPAEIIGTDPETDLAVIQAQDVSDLTPADLGSSGQLAVGEQVVAIGAPLGLDSTVTAGIVSALNRPIVAGEQQGEQTYHQAIQTDAPINRGNSGGPLVNMAGEVIGINSSILTTGSDAGSIGLGFAIPVDLARPIVEELIETGEATHARIGISVGEPQDGTAGALVAGVEPNSSAEEAGLQEGDIITAINDERVGDAVSLIAATRSYRPGDDVTLTYLRDGEEQTVELTLSSDAEIT